MAERWAKMQMAAAMMNLKKQYHFRHIYMRNNEVTAPSLAIITGASLLGYFLYRKARYDPHVTILGSNKWIEEHHHPELAPAIVSESTLEKRSPVNWTFNRQLERPQNRIDQIRMPTVAGP